MKRFFVVTTVVAIAAVGSITAIRAATTPPYGSVRGVVTLVGDSNIVFGSLYLNAFMTASEIGYVPVFLAAGGAAIRWNGCLFGPCPDPQRTDYWATRIQQARQQVSSDAYLVELGINDAWAYGTATTRGYASYGAKIDYIMQLLPRRRPVLWTTLPCRIEPAATQNGCHYINNALLAAPSRWPNLTIANWSTVANNHPEYMLAPGTDVHYSVTGHVAYTRFVVAALNAKLPFD
jgi:hypothetical protein